MCKSYEAYCCKKLKNTFNVLGVIPARLGSKRIKFKNIKKFNNEPLIAQTIKIAKKSKLINTLIVSTDSRKIAEIAKKYKVDVPFLRPKKYATDTSTDFSVIKHALYFYIKKKIFYDYVLFLKPTIVFKKTRHIDEAIKKIYKYKYDSLRSISPSRYSPYIMYKMKRNNIVPLIHKKYNTKRSQDLPLAYQPNGIIEIISSKNILKQKTMYGNNTGFYLISNEEALLDIDTELDFYIAEKVVKKI